MKTLILTTLSVVTLGMVSFALPAKADIVYITVTGTVIVGDHNNIDGDGVFGTAGSDLTGDAYTAQYTFDTNVGDIYNAITANYAEGGGAYGYATPSIAASLTINGQTFSTVGNYVARILGQNDGITSNFDVEVVSQSGTDLRNDIDGSPGTSPASITAPFTIYASDNSDANGDFADGGANATILNLAPSVYTLSLTDPTAVPEPASNLTFLALGMIGMGVIARRRTHT